MKDSEPMRRGMCSGKICFTYREAHEKLHKVKKTGPRRSSNKRAYSTSKVIPKRAYYCKSCGMWHLTSLPAYKEY